MHVHFIQHEVFEAPGAFLDWAKRRDCTISFSRTFAGEPLPGTLDEIDLLVVMGGPQSPDTARADCPHFNALAEIGLIKKAADAGKAVVGICLGAQLIGEAFGARFEPSPETEIGVFPMQLTPMGMEDNKISHFGSPLLVGHWHNDMPGLPAGSKVLATSAGCPRQIVVYSDRVYGFQCHMELTPEVVDLLIAEDEAFLNNSDLSFVQKASEIRSYDFTGMNEKLFAFLDKLILR